VAAALGKPLDGNDGDLRITLNYIHPASASESDFLYGKPFSGRSQKRRRKRLVVEVGALLKTPPLVFQSVWNWNCMMIRGLYRQYFTVTRLSFHISTVSVFTELPNLFHAQRFANSG
jgi:hypothetical protein